MVVTKVEYQKQRNKQITTCYNNHFNSKWFFICNFINMKETFYFSHDYNARTDDKIKKLFRKLGVEGYGLYWCIVEDLYNNANALQLDYEGLAFDYRTDIKTIQSLIEDFNLFIVEGEIFYSKSVGERLYKRDEKSAKARESANKRWKGDNANALQTHTDSNAIKESKVKEIKIYKSKEDLPLEEIKEEAIRFMKLWNSKFEREYQVTDKYKDAYIKLRKDYTKTDLEKGTRNYIEKVGSWNNEEKEKYELHILKFITQGNGFITYI